MSVVKFAGKKALVFGGTSGIGLAAARMLIAGGATVISFGRSAEKIATTERTFTDDAAARAPGVVGGSGSAAAVDILDRDALQAVFSEHEGFDYLVCCATGGSRAIGPFMDMDMDGFAGSFAKLWGYANATRFGVGHMAPDGAVVLVSGSPARKCGAGQVALSCVGGAVENLVRALAVEIAPRRINGVSPGLIDTPMFDAQGDNKAKFFATATAKNPVPRAGLPEEVAGGILFALENTFVTGTVIDVDGGAAIPSL
jgi:NAD(P)-dependent dehydrogenase (short-subunit alcohol dehydrogenase family)